MRTKIGLIIFAHHKNLIMGGGARIAATVHKLKKSVQIGRAEGRERELRGERWKGGAGE